MKRAIKRGGMGVLGFAMAAMLSISPAAKAIGPDYQYIADSGYGGGGTFGAVSSPTLNEVVRLVSAGGASVTGTVIGAVTSGTDTYLSVLTAAHVTAINPTVVDFGSGFSGTAPAYSQANGVYTAPTNSGYLLQGTPTGISTTYYFPGQARPEDISIVQVKISQAQAPAGSMAAAELSLVTNPADIPTLVDAFGNGGAAGNFNIGFTQYGYGRAGVFNMQAWPAGLPADAARPAAPLSGYTTINNTYGVAPNQTNGGVGYRRFQNNQATSIAAVSTINNYTMPTVVYNVTTPGVAGGNVTGIGGTGFAGDSGGPLMTSTAGDSVTVIPNLAAGAITASTNPTLIPVNDTNSIGGEYVGYSSNSNRYSSGGIAYAETKTTATTNLAVPLLNTADTNTLAGSMGNFGSLEWASQYTTTGLLLGNMVGNTPNRVNGAVGGPLSIPEPSGLALVFAATLAMLRRKSARPLSLAVVATTAALSVPITANAQYMYPANEPAAATYVAQQQSQFSAAASVLMVLGSGVPTPVNYTTTGPYTTVQQNLSAMIAQNNATTPSNVFTADAFGIQGTLAAIDKTRTYVAYVGFTGAGNGPNQANYTLAYNISHYKQDGTALMMQMNRVTNTPTYRWMDVYGFTSPAKTGPPTANPNTAYTINGFYVRDPWFKYYMAPTTSAAIKASTSQGISSNMFLENGNNLLWNQMFKPYQPYMPTAVGVGATITNVPDVTFNKAGSPYNGTTAINHYQFVTDPDEQDINFNTEDTSSDTQATSDSIAIADAQDAFSGASEGGADAGLAALPEFEGGSFQTTGDADISMPFVPDDSEWVLGYYPTGSSAPTGIVVIDQDTGDLSGAFWNDDDTTLDLSNAEADLSDDADDFDPDPSVIVIPEPAEMGVLAISAIMLRRGRSRGRS